MPCDFAIVERNLGRAEDLVIFVAFAGQQDDVVGSGRVDRRLDRRAAVRLNGDPRIGRILEARKDVLDDFERILGSRIVAGHEDPVGHLPAHAGHSRPFGLVSVASAAEQRNEFSLAQRPQRRQDIFEGVIGVGVIHQHRKRLSRPHRFQPSRHALEGRQAARHRRQIESRRQAQPRRRKMIADIVEPRHRRSNLAPKTVKLDGKNHAVHIDRIDPAGDVGRFIDCVPQNPAADLGGDFLAYRRLFIENRRRMDRQTREQPHLGRKILLLGLVIVEVIAGQIGKRRRREIHARQAILRQGVRAGLDGHVLGAVVEHLASELRDLQGVGSGQRRRDRFSVAGVIDNRSDKSAILPGRPDHRPRQKRHGRFALGSRYRQVGQLRRGVAARGLRQDPQRLGTVGDNHSLGLAAFDLALTDHNRRTAFDGLRDESVAVGVRAHDGDEDIARLDLPGIGTNAGPWAGAGE